MNREIARRRSNDSWTTVKAEEVLTGRPVVKPAARVIQQVPRPCVESVAGKGVSLIQPGARQFLTLLSWGEHTARR